jgi:hypothetical protein
MAIDKRPARKAPAVQSSSYRVIRLAFDVGQPYEKFRARFEAAVPTMDSQSPATAAGRHVRPLEISTEPTLLSPHGFVLHSRTDTVPQMTDTGELRPSTAYLMGSPAVTERLYRLNPAVLLCMPLRALIYIDAAYRTLFAVDQPSTLFSGFAHPAFADAGRDLDDRLAGLLRALGVKADLPLRALAWPLPATANGHLGA